MISKFLTLTVGLLAWLPLLGDSVLSVGGGSGSTGDTITVPVNLENDVEVQGWSFGICHDPLNLALLGAVDGATTLTVNGGGPPDFNQLSVEADGLTVGVVISFLGTSILPVGSGYELLLVDYELTGIPDVAPIVATTCFCDTLGVPAVATLLVSGGQSIVPLQECGEFTIAPPPDFCLDMVCEGGTADASLSWSECSTFDYFLLHRDGELISMFDAGIFEYLDLGLDPGSYFYQLIGVVFPDPTGTPEVLVATCEVQIIPVTIATIDPPSGHYLGGTQLTITGTGFLAASDTTVNLGGIPAEEVTVQDDTSLTCIAPVSTSGIGPVNIDVMNSLGSDSVSDGFLYGFKRGIVNGDTRIDVGDPVFQLEWLFLDGPAPDCIDAADTDDNGMIDIGDAIYVLMYLFRDGQPPAEPFFVAGLDETDNDPYDCTP